VNKVSSELTKQTGPTQIQQILTAALTAPVYDIADKTPLQPMPLLSDRLGCEVLIKREDLQPVHSFKLRGAYTKLARLTDEERARGVMAASAGNHAQGLALAAQKMGVKATIIMPRTTPGIKVSAVRKFGAEVQLHGTSFNDALDYAETLAREEGRIIIPPYNDLDIIAGQGTVGLELLSQATDLDAVYIPVGGGGMAAGIGAVMKAVNPDIQLIAVEAEDSACYQAAHAAGKPVDLERVGLFADGIAVRRIGDITFDILEQTMDDIITVKTDEICAAIQDIFNDVRAIAEPAGAVSVAGLKKGQQKYQHKRVAVLLSGANINFHSLRHVSERSELGESGEVVLAATIDEHAGSFRNFCQILGKRAITEFNYRLADQTKANIFVGIKVQDAEHERNDIISQLNNNGIPTLDLSDDEMSKVHLRYMVGGIPPMRFREQVVSFDFPEVPGALMNFLNTLGDRWNITLFHYRNHGAAYGRVLAGFDVPEEQQNDFETYLQELGYRYTNQSHNPAYHCFLNPF
jgi:threonine dehydratase